MKVAIICVVPLLLMYLGTSENLLVYLLAAQRPTENRPTSHLTGRTVDPLEEGTTPRLQETREQKIERKVDPRPDHYVNSTRPDDVEKDRNDEVV